MESSQPKTKKDINLNRKSKQQEKKSRHNPLRILIIEPSGRYCRSVWCAIGLGLVHILIGATNMSVLLYALMKEDTHAAFCAIAVSIL